MKWENGGIDDLDLHNIEVCEHQVKADSRVGITLDDVCKVQEMLRGTEYAKGLEDKIIYVGVTRGENSDVKHHCTPCSSKGDFGTET